MAVYIYSFAATPGRRAAIMSKLRHTLEHAYYYGRKAIAVCKKPLRPLLVRYGLNHCTTRNNTLVAPHFPHVACTVAAVRPLQ
jgi:hypothetical protein